MQKTIKMLLGGAGSLVLGACCCQEEECIEYQDIVTLTVFNEDKQYAEVYFDSVVIKSNDFIVGCGSNLNKMLGSKIDNIKFPIDIQVQLFINGKGLKELSFEMQKNTELNFYTKGYRDCDFLNEEPKEHNYIDYSPLNEDGYCWIIKEIKEESMDRCVKSDLRKINYCLYESN
jgi:hypothetical protein